uniref:Zinc finger, CCHC-type n=1 Tax=Tanacetum cinerariifolium TaxID=118510 RepID=A0A6L2MG93_TANCI|nr:zinc finger, CCHC-type [Tanacetum cinerariifolium]
MTIETEKNAASRSTVENRGRDDLRQNPKKSGLDSDFTSMWEDFRVALNTFSGDLKREIHNLKDSFMGEITKIHEEFGEEVSTLHQVIEALQANMVLYNRSLASGGENTNHGPKIDVSKPSPFWRRRYGDIEQGTATIDTWVEFVVDFKKQFYWENAKNEAKSRLHKLKQSGTIREYVKEFTTLVLEIPELSDQDSLFYFLDGLQGWDKTELKRRGVQDLFTAIAHVEALIDFSTRRESFKPKDQKVNQEKGEEEKNAQPKIDPTRKPPTEKDKNLKISYKSGGCFIFVGPYRARDCSKKASLNGMSAHEKEDASGGGSMGSIRILNAIKAKTKVPKVVGKVLQYVEASINGVKVRALVDSGATHNFVADDEAKRLGINATKRSGTIKAVNSLDKAIHGVAKDVLAKIEEWDGMIDLSVVPMDDIKVVLGLEFLDKVRVFPMSFANSLCILDGGKTCMVSMERDAKSEAKTLSAMKFKKGFNKSEPCYLAVTRLDTGEILHQVGFEIEVLPSTDSGWRRGQDNVCHSVFQVLRDNELYVKLENFFFAQDEAKFLGHKIKDGGLMMDGAKIKANQDWEPPTKVTELRSFLGLMNYYRRFIMGYSAIASPLMGLLKKNKAWIWDEECQAAFESLKKAVMEEPVLRLPNVTMPFELHTDASNFAIRGILMQDGHPIAFESRKLNETKRKYTVQEKEMTTVIHCLRIWRHYLLGSRFVIKTNNISTSYFLTQNKLSPKQARWQDFLAEFDYQLEYKPGKANVGDLRREILKECHDLKWAGHPRITRTLALVEGSYYWPRMRDNVETFVRACLICQQNKIEQKNSGGLLEPLPTLKGPYESVSMDFITCLPKSEGGCFWTELFKIMGTNLNFSTSFHPQTDGQTKRVNVIYLRHYVIANQHDWAKLLDVAQFSYNMQRSEATGKSPFELVTGRQPLTPNALVASYERSSPAAYKTIKEWHEQADLDRALLDKAAKKMKKWADEKRRHVEFEVGDQVKVKLLPQQFKSLRKVHKGLIWSERLIVAVCGRDQEISRGWHDEDVASLGGGGCHVPPIFTRLPGIRASLEERVVFQDWSLCVTTSHLSYTFDQGCHCEAIVKVHGVLPSSRWEDGWMEVRVWKFNSSSAELRNDRIPMHLRLITYEGNIPGLIVCGLEIQPMGHILNGISDSLFDVYTNVESEKKLWDSLKSKYMVEDSSSKKFLDFKHTLKHGKDDLSLVQLGIHLRIEEFLRTQDCDKEKGKEVSGTSINMTEEGKNKHDKQNKGKKRSYENNSGSSSNKKPKLEYWKYGKTDHFKRDFCSGKKNITNAGGSGKESKDQSQDQGGEHFAPIHGKGSVALEFSSVKTVTLINVLYVPKLRKNLVSGPVLNKCGYKQVYESDKYILSKCGVFVGFGYYNNEHVHYKRMLEMSKDDLIPAINEKPEKCTTCCRAIVRLLDPKQKTLGEKGIDCIFVGYAEHSKAYRLQMDLQKEMKVDGIIEKFKARLVIQGFRKKEGIDYFDTYAPVARIITSRLLLTITLNRLERPIHWDPQVVSEPVENSKVLPPKTTEEVLAREGERKARTTFLMEIPEDHLAKFYKMTDAKEKREAIKSKFGGNDESKKMQKYLLKQQFKSFSPGVDTLNFDDLYNNLRVFESDVKGSTRSSSSTQNVVFVSSNNTSSTNEVNTAFGVSTSSGHNLQKEGSSSYTDGLMYSFFANQSSGPQLEHEDLKQVDDFNLEEMDLKWQKERCMNTGYKTKDNRKRPAKQDEHKAMVTIDGEGIDWTGHAADETEDYALMAFNSSYSGSDTKPITAENKANHTVGPKKTHNSACTQDSFNARNSKIKADNAQEYYVLPLWSSYTSTVKRTQANNRGEKLNKDTDSKTNKKSVDQEDQAFLEELKRLKRQEKEELLEPAVLPMCASTSVNAASTPLNTASLPTNQDDSQIPALEDIYDHSGDDIFTSASYDDEGAVADFTNFETTVNVSPIPTSRIHFIHPTTQILRDPTLAFQTRSKVNKSFGAHAFVYRNKKNERGVVVRNKARLVAQGHRQEEGIYYDEVFALVARIEAIRIFLSFASYIGFIVYQMDVKSSFLYGKIDEEVYVSQPPGFIDPKFPNKKEDGIFISQDKYVAEILKKFDFLSVKTVSTPIETKKPLVKDEEAADVDVLGHSKDFTSSSCEEDLSCKKQTIVATSTIEAEYVVAVSFCGQVLWIQNQMLDYDFNFMNTKIYIDNESTICIVKNPMFHSKTKHIKIRHHFIRDAYEKKLIQVLKIHTDANVADLLTKAFDVSRNFVLLVQKLILLGFVCAAQQCFRIVMLIKLGKKMQFGLVLGALNEKTEGNSEFYEIVDFLTSSTIHHALIVSPTIYTSNIGQVWNTASSQTLNNKKQILATIDSKAVVVTEASIRSSLLFNDADGTACLTNEAIFHKMGYEGELDKLTFQKALFSPQWNHDTAQDSRDSLEGTNGSEGDQVQSPHDSPLSSSHTSNRAEGSLKLKELFSICTNLSNRVLTLEIVKDAQAAKIISLKARIKKLEKRCNPSISHHRAWLKSVQSTLDDVDADHGIDIEEPMNQGRLSEETEELVSTARTKDSIVRPDVGTANLIVPTIISIFDDEDITMDQTLIKMKEEKAKEKGVAIKDIEDSSRPARSILTLKPLPTIDPKDKGKGVLEEPELAKKMTRSDLDAVQIAKDAEVARLVYEEELAELEREKEKRQREEEASKAAIAKMYDEVQAGIEVDALFIAKLQQEERKEQKRVIDDFKPMDSDDAVEKEKVLEEPDNTNIEIVPNEEGEVDYEVLDKRFLIINWESKFYHLDRYRVEYIYYRIVRSDGSSRWIKTFSEMVTRVHTLPLEDGTEIYMLAEKRYPLIKETLERMLALRLIAECESEAVFDLLRFIQKQIDKSGSRDGSEKDLAPCYCNEALAIPKQTATDSSMKDIGEADVILGIKIKVSTPMDPVEKLKPNTEKLVDQLEYSRAIGCLMYAMTSTRSGIAYVVGRLSRFTSNPSRQHWKAITRVFKYLRGTKDYGLSYVGYPSMLEGYSDTSWINHVEDSTSTSGWVFLLVGGAISWAFKKRTCITISTMESKFVALAAAGKEAEWLRNLIHEILIWPKPIAPISIRCDSDPTMARAYSQIYNGKSRHLGVRHSMVKELIRNGMISIEFVRTQHNLADHLTKGLAKDLVQDLKGPPI